MTQPHPKKRILIIQTAFIGDVILATAVVEKLRKYFPLAGIDFLVRSGNESLLHNNPCIDNVLVWNKKSLKLWRLFQTALKVRSNNYDMVINLHRFASSGFITCLSKSKIKSGFKKNPFSFCYTINCDHSLNTGMHEVERNQLLIEKFTDSKAERPKLYPSESDFEKIKTITGPNKHVTIAPASVWFTKQFPSIKWLELIETLPDAVTVFLTGGKGDTTRCNQLVKNCRSKKLINRAGTLSFMESAALMKHAVMNYVNDSAPCHLASSVDAPVTEVFCSTIPEFGFGPLSNLSFVVQTNETLSCRPCGIHGFNHCPEKHFKCATTINASQFPDVKGNE